VTGVGDHVDRASGARTVRGRVTDGAVIGQFFGRVFFAAADCAMRLSPLCALGLSGRRSAADCTRDAAADVQDVRPPRPPAGPPPLLPPLLLLPDVLMSIASTAILRPPDPPRTSDDTSMTTEARRET